MINPFKEVNWNPDRAERKQFARSLVLGFPALAFVFFLVGWAKTGQWNVHLSAALWIAAAGVAAGLLLLAFPFLAKPLYVAWYFLACCIGLVIGNLLMAGFFFAVLTPIAFLMRLSRRKHMQKGFNREATTYWRDAEPVSDLKRYYHQF
ncbi:MAG: SxtJ family membrane protein [Candidatus Omnitrophica bacterium]|nr:SxtJ family membrane protein [Candidatus Omnitrophota bacterium]